MIPASFDYVRPGTLEEALAILRDREGEAKVLAGGYSLIPLLKLRLAPAGAAGGHRRRRRPRRDRRRRRRAAHRRPDHAPPDPAARRAGAGPRRCCATRRAASATRRSATGARSAARAPTPTRRPTGRPSCIARGRRRRLPQRVRRAGGRRPRVLHRQRSRRPSSPTEILTEVRVPIAAAAAPGGAYAEARAARPATSPRWASRSSCTLGADGRIDASGSALTAVARDAVRGHRRGGGARRRHARSRGVRARPGARPRRRRSPVADGHGPVDYKRAMVREMAVRALRARRRARGRVRRGTTDDHPPRLGHRQRDGVREADVEPRLLLVHLLRDVFGLTGTHVGCDTSNCGACTVLVDGRSAKSLHDARRPGRRRHRHDHRGHGSRAATLHPLQQAFWDQHGLQCGFCTPGMIMQSAWLLGAEPGPDRGGDPRGDRGQPLPLHRLREHRARPIQQAADERRAPSEAPPARP